MTSPIDPIRRAAMLRRAQRSEADAVGDEAADAPEAVPNLPVPVGQARTVRQAAPTEAAIFAAQLIGQDGQKRGLRGGPAVIDSAKSSYNRTEWSGSKDRRARSGKIAKTDI